MIDARATTAPRARPSATMGATSRRSTPGMAAARTGLRMRIEAADGEQLLALPGRLDDGVGRHGRGRHRGRAARGEDDHLVIGRGDDEAARKAEVVGQALEDDLRLADRIGHLVESGADVDQRLEVGPPLAKLALVQGRERGRRQGEQPEGGHVEDRHRLELDGATGDHVDRRDELRRLGVEHDEEQQRVPERDLQPGPIRGQQRDRHELQVDQEADGALRAAGRVHRPGEVETIRQQRQRDEPVAEAREAAAGQLDQTAAPTT